MSMETIQAPNLAVEAYNPMAMYADPNRLTVAEMAVPAVEATKDAVTQAGDLIADTYASMSANARRATAVGAATLVAVGGLGAGAGVAEATPKTGNVAPVVTTTQEGNTTYTTTSTSTILMGRSSMSSSAFAKLKVVGNHRTVSKAEVAKDKKAGKCDSLTAAQVIKRGIRTQGYNGSGTGYALENRPSVMCDSDGDGDYDYRANCGNAAIGGRPQPKKARQIVWVNNFNKANVAARTAVSVEAESVCRIEVAPGTFVSASARGFASASASARLRLRQAIKANGAGKVTTNQRNVLEAQLKAQASAQAETNCEAKKGEVPTPPKPPTPETPNAKPVVEIANREHMFIRGTAEFCAYGRDADGQQDIVNRDIVMSGAISRTSAVYPGDEEGEFCAMGRAATTAGEGNVRAIVIDSKGQPAEATLRFPVLDDTQPGTPGAF